MPDAADEMREIAAIDGVNTHIAGSAARPPTPPRPSTGIDSTLLCRRCSAWSS